MGKRRNPSRVALAMLGLLELSSFSAVLAAPPHPAPPILHPAAVLPATLDLRAPRAARLDASASVSDPTLFPSPRHRSLYAQPPLQIPALGADDAQSRIPSRMEEFARHVHREGLPL